MNPFDMIDPLIQQFTTLSGTRLVIVFLVMAGYMMKMIPKVPNRWIPILNCFLIGPALSVLLVGWPANGDIAPDVRFPEVAAWVQAYVKGLLLGVIAWLAHGMVLKRFVDEKVEAWKKNPSAVVGDVSKAASVLLLLCLTSGCAWSVGGKYGLTSKPVNLPANRIVNVSQTTVGINVGMNQATQTPEFQIGYKRFSAQIIPTSTNMINTVPFRVTMGVRKDGFDAGIAEAVESGTAAK